MNKKAEFYVNCPRCYLKKSGYIKTFSDNNGNDFSIGFIKIPDVNKWRAVELQTGLKCSRYDYKTLKFCIDDVKSSLYLFEDLMKTQLKSWLRKKAGNIGGKSLMLMRKF